MGKLKDKLNSVPQDFDRENLWDKIQSKKKRKRHFLWLWSLPMFVLYGILFATWDSGLIESKDEISTAEISTLQTDNISAMNKKQEVSFMSSESNPKDSSEIRNSSDNLIIEGTKKGYEIAQADHTYRIHKNTSSFVQKVSKKGGVTTRKSKESYTNTYLANDDIMEPSGEHRLSDEAVSLGEGEERSLMVMGPIGVLPLTDLLLVPKVARSQVEAKYAKPIHLESAAYDLPFYIRVGAGVGVDRPVFEQASRQNEKGLEALVACIELEQFFTNRMSLSGGLSYARNTTNLRFEESQPLSRFVEGSFTGDRLVTSYDLYNVYTRFDATLSLNYLFQFGDLTASPSFGFGYNLLSKADGDNREDGGKLEPLSSLGYKESSGSFGEVRLGLQYELENRMILGVSGALQSSRNLDIDKHHSIRPAQLAVFVKKIIK